MDKIPKILILVLSIILCLSILLNLYLGLYKFFDTHVKNDYYFKVTSVTFNKNSCPTAVSPTYMSKQIIYHQACDKDMITFMISADYDSGEGEIFQNDISYMFVGSVNDNEDASGSYYSIKPNNDIDKVGEFQATLVFKENMIAIQLINSDLEQVMGYMNQIRKVNLKFEYHRYYSL